MALRECENGHIYDDGSYSSCPYCNGGIYRVDFGSESGQPTVGRDDPGETGKTVLLDENLRDTRYGDVGKTVLLEDEDSTTSTTCDDIGKTVLLDEYDTSFVSLLVCTDGPDKGRSIILRPDEAIDLKGGRYIFKQ